MMFPGSFEENKERAYDFVDSCLVVFFHHSASCSLGCGVQSSNVAVDMRVFGASQK